MKALVLSGGSIKGAFQVGAIEYLLGDGGFQPDFIYGMSVGALNGAFLVDRAGQQAVKDKDQPVNWKSIGKELTSFWTTNITSRSEEHTSEPSHLGISYAGFCLE